MGLRCWSRMLWMTVVMVVLSGLLVVEGHKFKVGGCPDVEVQKDFDMEKFLGQWYVIQKTTTTSSCMKLNITKKDDDTYSIKEYSRTYPFKAVGLDHTTIHDGRLRRKEGESDTAKWELKFGYSPVGNTDFWIVSTDYSSYAATWTCETLLWGHLQDAQILSRTPTLDLEKRNKLRRKFESFGINEHTLSNIDQKKCEGMLNTKADHTGIISVGPYHFNRGN